MSEEYSTTHSLQPFGGIIAPVSTNRGSTSHVGSWQSPSWLILSIVMVVGITVAHYWTDMSNVSVHNLLRRLPYIPIVLAAFSNGFRGGILTAVAACITYSPHAFFSVHRDPSPTVDKVLEHSLPNRIPSPLSRARESMRSIAGELGAPSPDCGV